MLKNDTLKNDTSRIGLYGSPPPPRFLLQQLTINTKFEIISSYCLTKSSIRAKRSISRIFFSCLSFPAPFLYIARTKAVLTGLKAY